MILDYLENTIVVSAPKRSGGTLLTRLFDNHPDVMTFIDEAFFWEHAYNYYSIGKERYFVDIFKKFTAEEIEISLIDRDILPWCEGIYKQIAPKPWELALDWDSQKFIESLRSLKDCNSISEVWNVLVYSHAVAMNKGIDFPKTAFLFGGDYGRAMIASRNTLKKSKGVFIIRNPFYAMESLKKSRMMRNEKVLHPINFAQDLSYYFFFWDNRSEILNEHTILIKFEDIILELEKTMRIISEHVGIEYNSNLLVPTLQGKKWDGDSSFHALKGIAQETVTRKITTLNINEIEFISEHLKPLLDYFDYSVPETKI